MSLNTSIITDRYHRLANKRRFWWVITTLVLVGLFWLARVAEPANLIVYQQLVVLYAIDSVLFFLTDRINAKMGALSLIFLVTMEVIITAFYLISLTSGSQL
ncbi:MAG: hypothetical protein Q8Q05_01160 [bacterium]|nr:hypothetical protein [bacterium]